MCKEWRTLSLCEKEKHEMYQPKWYCTRTFQYWYVFITLSWSGLTHLGKLSHYYLLTTLLKQYIRFMYFWSVIPLSPFFHHSPLAPYYRFCVCFHLYLYCHTNGFNIKKNISFALHNRWYRQRKEGKRKLFWPKLSKFSNTNQCFQKSFFYKCLIFMGVRSKFRKKWGFNVN